MSNLKYIVCVMIFGLLASVSLKAQNDTILIYGVTFGESKYEIEALNTANGQVMPLYEVNVRSLLSLSEVSFPEAEINALRESFQSLKSTVGRSDLNFNDLSLKNEINALAVSPDGTHLAFNLFQEVCLMPGENDCFGVNRVTILEISSKSIRGEYVLGVNNQDLFHPSSASLKIRSIEWANSTFDLVVIIDNRFNVSSPPAIVHINPIDQKFNVIDEGLSFAIWKDNRTVAILKANEFGSQNIIRIITYDDSFEPVTDTTHVLGYWFLDKNAGMTFMGSLLIFSVALDTSIIDSGGAGIGALDWNSNTWFYLSTTSVVRISSSTGLVFQDTNNEVFIANFDGVTLQDIKSLGFFSINWRLLNNFIVAQENSEFVIQNIVDQSSLVSGGTLLDDRNIEGFFIWDIR
jgi:hypothetical protein